MTARLPIVGGDDGDWGAILNQFLQVAHNSDGTLNSTAVGNALPSSIPVTNLGSGTPSSSNFLRGDGTWAVPNSGSSSLATDTDVAITTPQNNQALFYDATASKWTNQAITEADVTNLTTDLAATEKVTNKGAASGYAPLNGSSLVPATNLGTGTASSSTYLRGDGTWVATPAAPVSSVFSRTGAVVAASGDYTAAQVTNAADKSSASAQTFTGNVTAPALVASGLTGATAASRYVGATSSGAPASGSFLVGDYIIDQTGAIWVCTTAGSPGTWTRASIVLDSSASDIQPTGTVAAAGSTGKAADAGHVHKQNMGGVFGSGSDGSATLDGTASVAWASKVGSTYTMTRDCQCTNVTINAGVTLNTSNCRIFCYGAFTNNGTVTNSGPSATSATGASWTSQTSGSAQFIANGQSGGNGGTTTGSSPGAWKIGWSNGATGGSGSSGAGGGGHTVLASSTLGYQNVYTALTGVVTMHSNVASLCGGGGGAGGGGDGTNAGGGGGAGGGTIVIIAFSAANSGTISCPGGNGFTPTTGNCGGGGGGDGGLILVYTHTAWTAGTTNVAGGTGGSGVGTGTAGGNGGSGSVINTLVI